MVPALYSIPWSDSLPALCGESVHLESEVERQDLRNAAALSLLISTSSVPGL